jgi:hypothetical protein
MATWQEIIDHHKLFWQYPAATEKQFYLQNKYFNNYVGFPWATVLDKHIDLEQVKAALRPFISQNIEYYTCCQHIRFRELEPIFDALKITTVYTPHVLKGEHTLRNRKKIKLLPCPLYAVNVEDETRNSEFRGKSLLEIDRRYKYSFVGGLQPGYLSDIRERIYALPTTGRGYVYMAFQRGGLQFSSKL